MVFHPLINISWKPFKSNKTFDSLNDLLVQHDKTFGKKGTQRKIFSLPTQEKEKAQEEQALTVKVQEEELHTMKFLKEEEDAIIQ
jgi:hypothetical protein